MDDALCPGRDETAANHCWHESSMVHMTNPPTRTERCCHCGATRSFEVPFMRTGTLADGHGPYASGGIRYG